MPTGSGSPSQCPKYNGQQDLNPLGYQLLGPRTCRVGGNVVRAKHARSTSHARTRALTGLLRRASRV